MPDHSIQTADAARHPAGGDAVAARGSSRRSRRERRTDWRLGGRTVQRWRESLLAVAMIGLGAGLLAAFAAQRLGLPTPAVLALLWLGMLVPVAWGLRLSRPVGLFAFRPVDLVWGLGLGLAVRLVQGWIAGADGVAASFPTPMTVDGQLAAGSWFTDAVAPVLIAAPVEELFFRGVVLVALFTVLRRPFGGFVAGLVALLVTTGLFVLAHGWDGASLEQVAAIGALGMVCGLLVLLTGRLWPAILTHAVFNATGAALLLLATL